MRKFKIGSWLKIEGKLLSSFTKDDFNKYRYSLFATKSEFIFVVSPNMSLENCRYIKSIGRIRDGKTINNLMELILSDEDVNFDLDCLDDIIELIRLANKNYQLGCIFSNSLTYVEN